MKKLSLPVLCGFLLLLNSCTVVGDIFKAGAIFTLIAIVVIIIIIIWVVSLFRNKN